MILEKFNRMNVNDLELTADLQTMSADLIRDYVRISYLYRGAMKVASTKLEILDEEFCTTYDHNPIHHIECRLKSWQSIIKKLEKRGLELTIHNITDHITDIAGIRVVCHYIDDIYRLAEVIEKQHDLALLRKTDYIKTPKPNGYRSLHLILEVPVSISEVVVRLPVEIQLRTIAMDMWASLEHELHYKSKRGISDKAAAELRDCAQNLADIDEQMQGIFRTRR